VHESGCTKLNISHSQEYRHIYAHLWTCVHNQGGWGAVQCGVRCVRSHGLVCPILGKCQKGPRMSFEKVIVRHRKANNRVASRRVTCVRERVCVCVATLLQIGRCGLTLIWYPPTGRKGEDDRSTILLLLLRTTSAPKPVFGCGQSISIVSLSVGSMFALLLLPSLLRRCMKYKGCRICGGLADSRASHGYAL
jgi:hypothetical protein